MQNTIQKILLPIGVLAIIGLLGWGAYIVINEKDQPNDNQNGDPIGIEVFEPKPGETVSAPLKIRGSVSGYGWTGFEGQGGIVKLFDSAGKELALGILTATTDWMKLPTIFETTLFFDYTGQGDGKLVFYNENASGEAERNRTFEIPVKLTDSSSETSKIKIYFTNTIADPQISCDKVFYLEREVAKTPAIARRALEELLEGPSDLEKLAGFTTSINPGVTIQGLTIENETAKVDFSSKLEEAVGGSCRVTAIRAQITETLKQFPTVKNVIISIDGRTEDILQP